MVRITKWDPEDQQFWEAEGKRCANRNLWISVPALMLAFIIWQIWSVVAVKLNDVGFNFTDSELFILAALPGFFGASLRLFFTFMPGAVGGKNWTVFSTLILLIPAIGIGIAVQNPDTSFMTLAILAALCGIGGGNFSSSMANISFFFPKRLKGTANGINGGFGNLGVSVVQFVTPAIIASGTFVGIFGAGQTMDNGNEIWLQNAAFIWVVPIVVVAIMALFAMDNLQVSSQTFKEQSVIFKNKHTWIMTMIYTSSFGSFIGYSAAFGLLMGISFPEVDSLKYVFLGPLVGALSRSVGGWLGDKYGGAIVTMVAFVSMVLATFGVMFFLAQSNFTGYLFTFLLLFLSTGIANGSVFQMIPNIFNTKQTAPVLGFTAAIAAYGAFIIPMIFKSSIANDSINNSFYLILATYALSLILCWYYYLRRNAEVQMDKAA